MKITIESSGELTTVDGHMVRKWNGVTERGARCIVFVARIAVLKSESQEQFERELKETAAPGELTGAYEPPRVIDLRHIL
jgi:hypothetical protein